MKQVIGFVAIFAGLILLVLGLSIVTHGSAAIGGVILAVAGFAFFTAWHSLLEPKRDAAEDM
jgi:hypothetical protein